MEKNVVYKIVWMLFLPLLIRSLLAEGPVSFNCYSIVVGKEASFDGSVLVAHNEDDFGNQVVNLYRVPEKSQQPMDSVIFKNGGKIAQHSRTHGFIWIQLPGMDVSDAYINDRGIMVCSDGCPSREENPELTDGGIVYWIRRLIAERAGTARQGVELAGSLIEKFGYASEGQTFIIADPGEAWMLAAVYGKHWVARRVPDDQVAVIPNYYTIGRIDLADSTQFLGSRDIIEYAIQNGWYDPENDGEFHFARAYTARKSIHHPGNTHRMLRGLNLLSEKHYRLDDAFPFSFKPKRKITLADLKQVLRDHYEGCEFDKSDYYTLGNPHELNGSTICAATTQFSIIAHLRGNLPVDIGTVVWFAPYRPGVQAYTPWYVGIETVPNRYAYTDHAAAMEQHFNPPPRIFQKDTMQVYWKFVEKVEQVDNNFKTNFEITQIKIKELEARIEDQMPPFENEVLKLYRIDPERARKMLTEFTARWAAEALK